ncbi:RNA chaperone Hfq [Pseudoalteromonas umbrosa]|uniref:RNA chaperone Hfq n=1 Tax=Pseudoalteromonas umbrosa TaxID=3048489 RepID=UPI0024C459CD|nr:RNA chaperone Hfq [Pseudoalteromonas sp. B95]MDK1290172.1 RNA chaperone Hfq [Pseudoalteromonas sp. B95]
MLNTQPQLRRNTLKLWQSERQLIRIYLANNISLTGYIAEHDDSSVLLELQGQDNAFTLIDRDKVLSICSHAYLGKS